MEAPAMRWDPEELNEAARIMNGFLDGEGRHQEELLQILDHHLMRDIGSETSSRLFDAISFYANEEFAGFFLGFLTYADQDEDLRETLQGLVTPSVGAYLRKALAMHGATATEAALVFGEDPRAWRDLRREVFFDVIAGVWRVRIEIDTYDGNTVTFNETPASTLVLAHATLDTLMAAIESAGTEVLDPDQVPVFVERIREFLDATKDMMPSDDEMDPELAGTYM